jgi:DNA-binding NarL/FixJ family response regulator
MTRVVLVEDHVGVREGLVVLLRHKGIDVAADVGTVAEAEEAIERVRPDVAVLDLLLPDGNGLDLTETLLDRFPNLAVLIYTGQEDGPWLQDALNCGARGLALKSGSSAELATAIERVAAGMSYIDPRLDGAIASRRAGNATVRRVLSPREREVLELAATGLTADGIAAQLFLSVETVRTHTRNAVRKLGARNRLHAVVLGISRGEITAPPDDGR